MNTPVLIPNTVVKPLQFAEVFLFFNIFSAVGDVCMIDIDTFLDDHLILLKKAFGKRLWFVGLQGSYARGEETESSDIDIVIILDQFTADDIYKYDELLNYLPERKLMCGFISGKNELINWQVSELFQFYYDTKLIIGDLDELLQMLDADAVNYAIKNGACAIYHTCVHNMLYEKSDEVLKALLKSATFIVQAICFKETGKYISKKSILFNSVDKDEQMIVDAFLSIKANAQIDFQAVSELLFNWSAKLIVRDYEYTMCSKAYSDIIGKTVNGIIDRPIGIRHPKHADMIYSVNYGYIPNVIGGDGEEQDVYYLGAKKPVKSFAEKVIAVYHRFNDNEDKWIVADTDHFTDEEILGAIDFQEKYFRGELYR